MEAYCVKCRSKKGIKDAKAITMKNGKPATQGVCPSCGTKMFRIGKAQKLYSDKNAVEEGWALFILMLGPFFNMWMVID